MNRHSSRTAAPALARRASRWEFRAVDQEIAARLRRELGCSGLMSRIFTGRGFFTPAEIEEFVNPPLAKIHDPYLLKGMDAAVARVEAAVARREPILIYGDYDVDGICSTAILKSVFTFLGIPAQTYIPHRLNEGYGLRCETVRALHQRGVKLLITVDNGTTAIQEVDLARSLGMDVIVTDHHEASGGIPNAAAVINPKQPGCEYPCKELCGAGVAFKFAHAILRRMSSCSEAGKEFLKSLLDYVALGTVADVVPLTAENRCFVAHGMKRLRTKCRPGVRSLLEVIGSGPDEMRAGNIAFTVAPRLNAAGRTEHAEFALELLLTEDPLRARELASMLDRFNDDRRRIESDITEEALGLIDEETDAPILVVEQEGWHLGVVGIVASRILDRYYRPVIVLGVDGEWAKGSARSIRGFDIHAALAACGEHLHQFGGHPMAAGLRLKSSKIEDFRRAVTAYARATLTESDFEPRLTIDARAEAADLTIENIDAIERLAPFGAANPKPLLSIEGLTLIEEARVIKERHLKLRLVSPEGQSFSAIGFGQAHRAPELGIGQRGLRLAGAPYINKWNGQSRLEIEFKDLSVES